MKQLRVKILLSRFKTQERFAAETGIDEALLSKYCRELRKPSEKHLAIIKKALKLK